MRIFSSCKIRIGVELIRGEILQNLSPLIERLELWTPPVFVQTHVQPNFLCLGSKTNRRISVIQLCGGSDVTMHLWQPSGVDQLFPGFTVSHELSFSWPSPALNWNKDNNWSLLISWLIDNLSIKEVERLTGCRRVAWNGGDAKAFEVARSLEVAILHFFECEMNLAEGIDVLGAERKYGRVAFPVCVNLASKSCRRLATIVVENVRSELELTTFGKDLTEYEGFDDGDLIVDEQLVVLAAWDGQNMEERCWKNAIRLALEWLKNI